MVMTTITIMVLYFFLEWVLPSPITDWLEKYIPMDWIAYVLFGIPVLGLIVLGIDLVGLGEISLWISIPLILEPIIHLGICVLMFIMAQPPKATIDAYNSCQRDFAKLLLEKGPSSIGMMDEIARKHGFNSWKDVEKVRR